MDCLGSSHIFMVLLGLPLGLVLGQFSASVQLSDEKRLIKHLLRNYERVGVLGRPVYSTSDTLTVNFGLALIQLLDLDEKNQVLTTNVWNRYQWTDVLLSWNPADFSGIDHVRVPVSQIWTPDIVLYNSVEPQRAATDALAVVSHDGTVLWIPPAIMKSSCTIDIMRFPFDEQECTMRFGSWTYDGFKLDVQFYNNLAEVDTNDYIQSNEWKLLSTPASRNVKHYACCDEPYPDLVFTLRLKRMASFYSYVIILPTILLSSLVLVIFLLPPESSEKITLGATVFVSFFVLLLILTESIPPAASSVPLIGAYLYLNMILITLSVFLSLAVSSVYLLGNGNKKLPTCLKQVLVDGLGKVFCMSVSGTRREAKANDTADAHEARLINNKDVKPSTDQLGPLESDVKEIRSMLMKSMGRLDDKDEQCQRANEWRIVARVLDKIFFVVYLVIFILALAILFSSY